MVNWPRSSKISIAKAASGNSEPRGVQTAVTWPRGGSLQLFLTGSGLALLFGLAAVAARRRYARAPAGADPASPPVL